MTSCHAFGDLCYALRHIWKSVFSWHYLHEFTLLLKYRQVSYGTDVFRAG